MYSTPHLQGSLRLLSRLAGLDQRPVARVVLRHRHYIISTAESVSSSCARAEVHKLKVNEANPTKGSQSSLRSQLQP